MKKIKVGVIGCGFIHNVYHMPALTQQREPDQMFTVASEKKVGEIVEKAETKKGWMYPTWNEVEAYGFPNELGHLSHA